MSGVNTGNLWDIFCRVIDNYGDVGVSWRLATGLAARGQRVRLWLDDPSALTWMASNGAPNVEVRHWTEPMRLTELELSDVLIETFGCEISPEFIAARAINTTARALKHRGFKYEVHGLKSGWAKSK